MGRFKMKGGSLFGVPWWGWLIIVLVIAGVGVGLFFGLRKSPPAPTPTTNDLDITLGSPMPQGCNGGGRIELGCNPTSISISVSLNKVKPQNTNAIATKNDIIHWNLTGLDKNGLTYNTTGTQILAKPTQFINLTTGSGISFKTMSGTIYLTDVNKNVGNSSSFSYP